MSLASGKISLFITLGIAAIDMLSCAFVSSVMLFVLFLMPQQSISGRDTGSQATLILHWVFASQNSTVLSIELTLPDQDPQVIYSDDPETLAQHCDALVRPQPATGSCNLIRPESPSDLSGMLVIQNPRPGAWKVSMSYADTVSHGGSHDEDPVDLRLTLIGKDTLTVAINGFRPIDEVDVRAKAAAAGKASLLDVEE